jgi:Protein of unknown function (DUF1566)
MFKNTDLLRGFLSALTLVSCAYVNAGCRTDIKADTPDSRFVINTTGTVYDTKTQLVWKQCPEGLSGVSCNVGAATVMNWKAALDAASASTFSGFSDWRLPNVKELTSIVEGSCYSPSINVSLFPNTPSRSFWSSSGYARDSWFAWSVYFDEGYAYYSDGKRDNKNVRLVRSGQ